MNQAEIAGILDGIEKWAAFGVAPKVGDSRTVGGVTRMFDGKTWAAPAKKAPGAGIGGFLGSLTKKDKKVQIAKSLSRTGQRMR